MNRFLLRESYDQFDLFNEVKQYIELIGGTLSIDDTVIEKLYSNPNLSEFIGYFWSGNKHKTIKGINLITLFYTDPNGISVPINYRLYNKEDNLSKNDYFRLMLSEVVAWGLRPSYVTGDSWYSSIELKTIHWGIECYHRALKQLCGINKFIVRKSEAILTHFFSSLRAFIKLELMRYKELIDNWYQLQREISLQVNRHFILEHLS